MDIDSFAGAGGASIGLERALGKPVDLAINHDEDALAVHEANHPGTRHVKNDVWSVNASKLARRGEVRVAWFSPDCTYFSRARAGRPQPAGRSRQVRDLARVVGPWSQLWQAQLIVVENVEEFGKWGPLDDEGQIVHRRRGEYFQKWVEELRSGGYVVDWRVLTASDYGAPTTRRRLIVVGRRDGHEPRWPRRNASAKDTSAAGCIDWEIPGTSIYMDSRRAKSRGLRRPLKPQTMARIRTGLAMGREPFLISLTHQGGDRVQRMSEPMPTITGANRGELAIVRPVVRTAARAGGKGCEVGMWRDSEGRWQTQERVAGRNRRTGRTGHDEVMDVTMRMLSARELFNAQGFPRDYEIARGARGGLSKTSQVRLCGNTVCPDLAEAVVRANLEGIRSA